MVHHAIALLTALTLLFASGTAVAGDHRCGGRSMPTSDCCCDHGESDEVEPQQDSKISGSCCQYRAPAPTVPPLVPVVLDVQAPVVLAAPVAIVALPPRLPGAIRIATKGSPPTVRGPPVFLLNCRFLI